MKGSNVTRFSKRRSLAHYFGITTSVKQTGNRAGRPTLYGTGTGIGLQGKQIKAQEPKRAAANAEYLYEAIVEQGRTKLADQSAAMIAESALAFDPTQPTDADWESCSLPQRPTSFANAKEKTNRQLSSPRSNRKPLRNGMEGSVILAAEVCSKYRNNMA